MTALDQLEQYLRRLERRARLAAATRGTAIIAALALALTLLFVWISNRYEFAQHVVLPLRIALFAAMASAIAAGLLLPLLKLNRMRVTRMAEQRTRNFEERLLTVAERPDAANPFTELVAEDALRVAREHEAGQREGRAVAAILASGLVAAAILVWLIAAGPGYWGYGASLLWTGRASAGKRPLYEVGVKPGNKTIRQKSDQLITAQLFGFSAHQVMLHAKYGGALKWEHVAMQPKPDGNGYQFLFAGVSDPIEYYVQADSAQSKHFTLSVKDLPGVKRVKVALHYPSGLGLRDVVEDPGGDVRAVQGTQADISVLTDRWLDEGFLVLENGSKIALAHGAGNWLIARLPVSKDGSYHVAALDSGELIRISNDYFIEAKKDEPATVRISRPGRDPHVSPIEEVPVTVEAADDFGVESMELHYSVNGGPEQVKPLLKTKGVKEAQGTTTLYFEDFKVVPGDIVSMYATARDANTTSRSDIIFAQAEPFDYKFSQSQQMSGMGGGGMGMGQQNNISERQKEIIAATWNEVRNGSAPRSVIQEHARFLSDLENKLGAEAKTLSDRMASRELGASGPQFQEFSKLMTQAASDMDNAVSDLKPAKWQDALPPEQKALQSLLRAEALFRDIQISFGQSGAGGGNGAQRDLARMFDLELDTSKNQYETGQSGASGQNDQQKAIDEAFQKLQMLAQRQQELAQQHAQQAAMEPRWQEEQLRREAEQLREQMQQLAQNSQGQQSSSPQSSSSSSSGQSSGNRSRNPQQQSHDADGQKMTDALQQAASALRSAEDEMRKAVSDHDLTAEQRAAAQLREAQEMLNKMLQQQAGSSVEDLARRAEQIADAQRDIANRMKQMYGEDGLTGGRMDPTGENGEDMPEMNDPNSMRFGYGFRRRWHQTPTHEPTGAEKWLAAEKEQLSKQLEDLERKMQQQADSLASTQPDASSNMRKALSEAEQKELALRMQKNAEWLREGFGDRNVGMEDSVTAGLDQLSRELQQVEEAVKSGKGLQNGQNDKTAEALAQVRSLREELERRGAQSDSGNQSGQAGQQGQPGQQPGQQSGRAGQPGRQLSQNGYQEADAPYGGPGPQGPVIDRRGVEAAISQLYGLRAHLDPHDRQLYGYIDLALGNLQHLTGAQAGLLDARIARDAAVSLERLEVELSKRVAQQATGARTAAPENSPEKYRDAVAEYFKKLSK